MVYSLPEELVFPHPSLAEPDGLLAVGGDLSVDRLVLAYANGIFPWYAENSPILWWSPDPRLILLPGDVHVPRSLRRVLNQGRFQITADKAFDRVVRNCAKVDRNEGYGTWLVPEMIAAYEELHRIGLAHSFEAWHDGALVGGLYGVALGRAFFGESMFHLVADSSKVAFVSAAAMLARRGYELIDCQQTTAHLLRFGGFETDRADFLDRVERALKHPTDQGSWTPYMEES
ncbi:MAG TPA: leucyl/phenylalanyl-tRNA--protein transferase [Desulfomicrobiaceae bacterium]|nr:leucyl/phenylalanyl-tRNA--protein transferase [Desulfomicrobiaceae bacterium]